MRGNSRLFTHSWSCINDVHGIRMRIRFENTLKKLFIFLTTCTEARQRLWTSSDRCLEMNRLIRIGSQVSNGYLLRWDEDRSEQVVDLDYGISNCQVAWPCWSTLERRSMVDMYHTCRNYYCHRLLANLDWEHPYAWIRLPRGTDPRSSRDRPELGRENRRASRRILSRRSSQASGFFFVVCHAPGFNWFNVAWRSAQSRSFGIINSAERKCFVRTRKGQPCWVVANLSTEEISEWRIYWREKEWKRSSNRRSLLCRSSFFSRSIYPSLSFPFWIDKNEMCSGQKDCACKQEKPEPFHREDRPFSYQLSVDEHWNDQRDVRSPPKKHKSRCECINSKSQGSFRRRSVTVFIRRLPMSLSFRKITTQCFHEHAPAHRKQPLENGDV